MGVEDAVAAHYATSELEARLLAVLEAHGTAIGALTAADLAPVDEFHIGGRQASEDLLPHLPVGPDGNLLDIGCGVGGPARFFAERLGCRVTGIDLTPDFVATAVSLTRRVGLQERIEFHGGNALDMPFAAESFDAATLLHVGMNIADKEGLVRETARVLKPGGTFVVYDVMQIGPGALTYPLPWASTSEESFPAVPERYRQALTAAGFTVVHERERRAMAVEFFRRMRERTEAGEGGPSLAPVMGETFKEKVANMVAAIGAGTIAPVEMVSVKAG